MGQIPVRKLVNNGDGSFFVPLSQGLFAIIDEVDAKRVGMFNWSAVRGGNNTYAQRNTPKDERELGRPRVIKLHRYILDFPESQIDHKDGNGLNCRRSNLREATNIENGRNSRLRHHNSSGYKGVVKTKNNTWQAVIKYDETQHFLGHCPTKEDAARRYDLYAIVYHGEFAKLNFTRSDYPQVVLPSDLPTPRENNKGERNPSAKLSLDNVREIRELLNMKVKGVEIARRYRVSSATISEISKGKKWKQC